MRFYSLFRSTTFSTNQKYRNRKFQKAVSLGYEKLEPKNLLAGMILEAGELVIFGGSGNDVGSVVNASSTTFTASLTGLQSQTYNRADVSKIVFIGLEGNDQFTNSTSIDSNLIGNDGNDTLIGGSGDDQINGGRGNDTLTGNDGEDTLVGFDGDDIARGGNGDDLIIGGDGENRLFGDGQDDLIFGGADIDELFGGDGADVLVGFEGDDILDTGNGGTGEGAGLNQNRDLALGLGGDDQLTGGTGLNVLYGGDGVDILTGGSGVNRLHGQNGNDILTGGASDDFLAGQNGDDVITGAGGNDYILPGQGDDRVDGQGGSDFVAVPFEQDDYKIFSEESTIGISGIGQGSDRLTGIESFAFLTVSVAVANAANPPAPDFTTTASAGASKRITIRPIIVAETNGSNRADFFGNAAQELEVKLLIDEIYAAADVDIQWEATRNWNNSAAKLPRISVDAFQTITEAGDAANVGSSDPTVIDMYFLNQAPGSTSSPSLSVNGFAFIDFSGVAFFNGSSLASTDNSDFRELTSRIAAHEIGHNLGLAHVNSPNNLLDPSPAAANLISAQIATIRGSQFSKDV